MSDSLFNFSVVPLATGAFEIQFSWSGATPHRKLDSKVTVPTICDSSSDSWVVLPQPIATAAGTMPSWTLISPQNARQLSCGSTSAADPQVTTTTVKAQLQLKVLKNTAAGIDAGLLTLTLI
ncbi:MAG: hypothetical protein H7279_12085 [Microbacteriaceae bacterium]|nr:hypothetical protein [Microbacteriaceae bacterium]